MQNKLLARFSICNNSIILAFNISGILYNGIWGLITTTYLSYIVMIVLSNIAMKLPNIFSASNIGMTELNWRKFFSYSIYSTIGNAFSQLIFNLDILILGYLIKDSLLVANYKVATIIPFALNFIPGVIMSFFYPILAKNTHNIQYVAQLKHKIIRLMLIITIPTSLILFIMANPLIQLIFGAKFTPSIVPFQILILGFPIAAMRILYGNFLASMGKAKFAMGFNCLIALVNVVVTYTLVKHYATIGAASGIVIVYTLATILAGIAVSGYLKQR
jgi:O-antigen/teichoic acid export membrane protein